jgi:hypothetical protein
MPRPRRRRPRAERQAFFYRAEALDGEGWKRRDILRMIAALEGEERYLDADADSVLLPIVDHVPPTGRTLGRLRFFRVRRSNLPAVEEAGSLSDLPIAEAAGLAEPTHIVFAPDRVVVAEYNHFAPRMSALAYYLRLKLDRMVEFGTFIQDEVLEQLDRLGDVRLVQLTARPSDALRQDLAGDLIWGTVEQARALGCSSSSATIPPVKTRVAMPRIHAARTKTLGNFGQVRDSRRSPSLRPEGSARRMCERSVGSRHRACGRRHSAPGPSRPVCIRGSCGGVLRSRGRMSPGLS